VKNRNYRTSHYGILSTLLLLPHPSVKVLSSAAYYDKKFSNFSLGETDTRSSAFLY